MSCSLGNRFPRSFSYTGRKSQASWSRTFRTLTFKLPMHYLDTGELKELYSLQSVLGREISLNKYGMIYDKGKNMPLAPFKFLLSYQDFSFDDNHLR
jgi:hypothetical protein